MAKHTVRLPPEDEKRNFPLVPIGERHFQITDILDETDDFILTKCECIDDVGRGISLLYRVALVGDFLWLTKLFLKCIGEPHHEGDMEIDTDAWIGRQFIGEVKHSNGYANIKKLIYVELPQTKIPDPKPLDESTIIPWDAGVV